MSPGSLRPSDTASSGRRLSQAVTSRCAGPPASPARIALDRAPVPSAQIRTRAR